MPFSRLDASHHAKTENGRNRCQPGSQQPDPPSLWRRTQIFREKPGRAKRHRVQFERQLELPPPIVFLPARIQVRPCASKPEEKRRTRQPKVPLSEEPQLIRAVIKIERSAIPISEQRSPARNVPACRNESASRGHRQRHFPPPRQSCSNLDVRARANQPQKTYRVSKHRQQCERRGGDPIAPPRSPKNRQPEASHPDRQIIVHETHVERIAVRQHGHAGSEIPRWTLRYRRGKGKDSPEKNQHANGNNHLLPYGNTHKLRHL